MKRITRALVAFLFCAASLSALDVRDGLVRIVVDNANGRVNFYRLTAVKGSQYEALLFDTDARTNFLAISLDSRRIKLGETEEFKVSVKRMANGAAVEFTSPILSLIQRIEFVKSTDSRIYNGFKISYEAKNIGPRDLKLALKQIWDTYLGEKSGLHFITNNIARFDSETIFQGDTMVSFLVSPGESASLGLLLDQLARPDLVIVANWKRLADSVWSYETLTRGFSLSPYSINDSALGLYWNEIILKSGDSHVFTHYLLSGGEGQEFVKNLKTGVTIANEPVITPDPATSSSKGKLLLDIQELKTLLVSLEAVIGSVDTVKNESVQSLLDRLTALEASLGSTK